MQEVAGRWVGAFECAMEVGESLSINSSCSLTLNVTLGLIGL